MTISLILDVVVVALLVPTIVFAVILNSRLSALRKNREELGRLIAAFNEATLRAESGIPRLRKASEEAAKALQERVERAQLLRDDLAFMVERAGQAADRLEGAVRTARDSGPVAGAPAPAAPIPSAAGRAVTPPAFMDVESAAAAAERVAMEAVAAAAKAAAAEVPLTAAPEMRPRPSAMTGGAAGASTRPVAPPRPSGTRTAAPAASRPATAPRPAPAALGAQSLGAVLASEASAASSPPSKAGFGDDERSEAERELLRALQSAR